MVHSPLRYPSTDMIIHSLTVDDMMYEIMGGSHQTGSNNPVGLNRNIDKILFHPGDVGEATEGWRMSCDEGEA